MSEFVKRDMVEIMERSVCLVPRKDSRYGITCHEYEYCKCDILTLQSQLTTANETIMRQEKERQSSERFWKEKLEEHQQKIKSIDCYIERDQKIVTLKQKLEIAVEALEHLECAMYDDCIICQALTMIKGEEK